MNPQRRNLFSVALLLVTLGAFSAPHPAEAAGFGNPLAAPLSSIASVFEGALGALVSVLEPHGAVASLPASENAAALVYVPVPTSTPQTVATTTVIYKYVTVPSSPALTITSGGVSQAELNQKLQELDDALQSQIAAITSGGPLMGQGGLYNEIAASNKVDQLSGVTITNSTIDAASIPNLAGTYLPLTGGTVSGLTRLSNASTTELSVYGSAYFGATATSSFLSNGALILAQALGVGSGGTGTSTAPAANQLLLSDASGDWEYVATSSLGIPVASGSTLPSTSAGNFYGFTSYADVPNTNNEFVWGPGPYYAYGSSFAPQYLDNPQNLSIKWLGDSWTSNYGLSNADEGFVDKVSNYRNLGAYNNGLSGSTCPGSAVTAFGGSGASLYVDEFGINDMRLYGTSVLPDYLACLMSYTLWQSAGTLQEGQSIALPANWTTSSVYYANIAIQTSSNNSPATFSIPGSAVYVVTTRAPGATATYTVTIDGTRYGPYTAASTGSYISAGSSEPYAQRFGGLSLGVHTVSIQKTGGTDPLTLMYVASNYDPENNSSPNSAPQTFIMGVGRMIPGTPGSSGYAYWGGSDAMVTQYNVAQQGLVDQLANDGIRVGYVDVNAYYDPNVAGNVQSDGLHPTDQGDTAIAHALIDQMTYGINAREHSIIGAVAQNFTFANGGIGIGTTTPWGLLSVDANDIGTGPELAVGSSTATNFIVADNGSVGIATTSPYASLSLSGTNAAATTFALRPASGQTANILDLYNSSGALTDVINSSNFFAIGTTTPYSPLEVWGPDTATTTAFAVVNTASTTAFAVYDNGNATYSGSLFQSSDERLKTDVTSLNASSSLADIEALNPVSYLRIDQPSSGENLGFLAQQAGSVFPELVSTTSATALTPGGTLTLNYVGLIAPIVKSIQALANELASLEQTVSGFAQSFSSHFIHGDTVEGNTVKAGTLCVAKSDGTDVCITGDQLSALLVGSSVTPTVSVSTSTAGTSTPPVLSINGNNPAEVEVGSTYSDLGATITGPSGDLNLGVQALVDGGATTSVSQISIDTSSVATHTIEYFAIDQNGLMGTATRTVVVYDPNTSLSTTTATTTQSVSTTSTSTATSTGQ